jgi:hypothetical protein
VLWAKVGLGGGGTLVRVAGWPSFMAASTSHLGSTSYQFNMTRVESVILLAPNPSRPTKEWGRQPHLGSVGPGHFATSSPRVILFEATSGFKHNEDMYGFWSI